MALTLSLHCLVSGFSLLCTQMYRTGLSLIVLGTCIWLTAAEPGAFVSRVWVADLRNGRYKNPVLHADYSDPDVIRVGMDYYMVASSFECVPGLPLLHSRDLVNWQLVGYALKRLVPEDHYARPRPGCGVWAPAIRYHNGTFYIFYADPDFGIYMVSATNITGPWTEPILVKQARGWIDPCPLWDDDGNAYLVSAMAPSRNGIKSVLIVSRLAPDGTRVLDNGVIVYDGGTTNHTVEGPKFYKHNGKYYIFAPAGGVTHGWQLVLCSTNVYGPYQARKVLHQGTTGVNGPHQGAWVRTETGEDWFIHFQDKGAFGRVVHLQPMRWAGEWPVIGVDPDGDGVGEPVLEYPKPQVKTQWAVMTPPDSDEFDQLQLGLQWQWQANPQPAWAFPTSLGFLRLYCVPVPTDARNFLEIPNLLLQKFPAPSFTATTRLTFNPLGKDEMAGLIVFGLDYAALAMSCAGPDAPICLVYLVCKNAERNGTNAVVAEVHAPTNSLLLRVHVMPDATCRFSYSTNGADFVEFGQPFRARKGRWTGAKVGIFALGGGGERRIGYADFDWFRIE